MKMSHLSSLWSKRFSHLSGTGMRGTQSRPTNLGMVLEETRKCSTESALWLSPFRVPIRQVGFPEAGA